MKQVNLSLGLRFGFSVALFVSACHKQPTDDGRSASQRATAEKTDQTAKKGALTEKEDPRRDLARQERNLERLRLDEAGSRKSGNHAAVWALKWDEHRTEGLIKKDKALVASGETHKAVEDPAAAKAERR